MIHLERILTLRQSSLFDSVSLEKVSVLAESLAERSFSASEEILKEGDECKNIFLVTNGSVRVRCSGDIAASLFISESLTGTEFLSGSIERRSSLERGKGVSSRFVRD